MSSYRRSLAVLLAALSLLTVPLVARTAADAALGDPYARNVEQWRTRRVASLTSETGWLTLVGLYPLERATTTFGRTASNDFALDHPSMPRRAGVFRMRDGKVRFEGARRSGVTHEGRIVDALDLEPEGAGKPTVLAVGSLRFFVIERGAQRYVRVRDVAHPARTSFRGIEYFPVQRNWAVEARFEPYDPPRKVTILDVLGLEREANLPGALVFERNGREWRLDAEGELDGKSQLFVMFADETSGKESYGAGRYLYVDAPRDGKTIVDFNKGYNPPCAFNDYATCPLPPPQNRLALRVEAGERTYDRAGR
jgi:hypothetical protein